jgi:hypothetical protein
MRRMLANRVSASLVFAGLGLIVVGAVLMVSGSPPGVLTGVLLLAGLLVTVTTALTFGLLGTTPVADDADPASGARRGDPAGPLGP